MSAQNHTATQPDIHEGIVSVMTEPGSADDFIALSPGMARPGLTGPVSLDLGEGTFKLVNVPHDVFLAASLPGLEVHLAPHIDAHIEALRVVAPDIAEQATGYANQLFRTLVANPSFSEVLARTGQLVSALREVGDQFYTELGRDVFGPTTARFVEGVLEGAPAGSTVAFLARDAEIIFVAAQVLAERPDIAAKELQLVYPTVNRLTLGIEDEMTGADQGGLAPHAEDYLMQQGFLNPNGVTLVDVGCWGTMVDAFLNLAEVGTVPARFDGVYFLYSHLGQIHGHMNLVARAAGLGSNGELEAIADTFEALPREMARTTALTVGDGGSIKPDYTGLVVDSPFLASWRGALLQGAREAADELRVRPDSFPNAEEALHILIEKQQEASQGQFTGVLGSHTPTWSHGEEWRSSWRWGQVPPIES